MDTSTILITFSELAKNFSRSPQRIPQILTTSFHGEYIFFVLLTNLWATIDSWQKVSLSRKHSHRIHLSYSGDYSIELQTLIAKRDHRSVLQSILSFKSYYASRTDVSFRDVNSSKFLNRFRANNLLWEFWNPGEKLWLK